MVIIMKNGNSKDKTGKKKSRSRGRPKGSKSGLPFATFSDAIQYCKVIWDKAHYKEASYAEMSRFMGLSTPKGIRVLAMLRDFYGVIEKTEIGNWRLTDAGKRVARNDSMALKEAFSKNLMFADLYNNFGNKNVTEGVILAYIRKNFKGVDAEETKNRLMEGLNIIKQAKKDVPELGPTIIENDNALSLLRLKYALKPPSKNEIEVLADSVIKILKTSTDDTLKLLSELMHEKRTNNEELLNLLNKAIERLNIKDDYDKAEEEGKPFKVNRVEESVTEPIQTE